MSGQEQLHLSLEIAKEVCSLVERIVNEVSPRFQAEIGKISLRNRVLFGLGLKICRSFECLADDAARGRSEAMHHLKTVVETFVYFHWVGQKPEETRAKLVVANAYHQKIKFFEKSDQAAHEAWKAMFHELTKDLTLEWTTFKNLTLKTLSYKVGQEIGGWYEKVYRRACEPAHIADLLDYMPVPEKYGHPQTKIPSLRAYVALDYGLCVMFALLKAGSVGPEFDKDIERLSARHTAIRSSQ